MLFGLALVLANAVFTPETISRLKVAWTYHTHATAPNPRAARIAAFECTPVFASGLLYVITPFDQVIALDPETGGERWRYDSRLADLGGYSEASARGITVDNGVVYFGTLDARLIALDARSGALRWQAKLGPDGNRGEYQVTSPPAIAGNNVIVGSSIADNGRATMERGTVRAFDKQTGALRWTWDPTPPGKTGAANAWAPISADAARDLVFIPTGSASPDFYGGLRPGNDLYANCVVALAASTGKLVWSFQVVHHDLWDYDVASRPELIQIGGKPAVAVLTKMGHYFALDRLTGRPLLPVEERAAPRTDVPGESASSRQPFPLSGVFTTQDFVPRPGWCAEQFHKLRYEGIFTPPSVEGSLEFPGNVGGANWGSGAYDSKRGLMFVAANRLATTVRLIPRAIYDKAGHGETGERLGEEYAPQTGAPFGMVRRTFIGPDGKPCNQEPWGAMVAIDVATGKVRWQAPMLVSLGGPMTVDGVVLFGGTIFETKLRAWAADNGRKLWETDLPASANSVPGTYVHKGKRYLVICAGGHGKVDGNQLSDDVIAYRLP
jgi:quinoprotein glucose dehydrogenase